MKFFQVQKQLLYGAISMPKFTSADVTDFAWKTYQETPKNTQKHDKKEWKTDK